MRLPSLPICTLRITVGIPVGLAAAFALLLAVGCATQSSKLTIKPNTPANQASAIPYSKVAVVAGVRRPELRMTVEDQVVASLRDRGITAETTYRDAPFEQLQQNPAGVARRLADKGWAAVLVLREVDRATADHDRAPGVDPFAAELYFDLVAPGYADTSAPGFYSSGYANAKTILTLEAKVRDLAGNQGVWSAACNATMGEDADRLAVLHRFADRLVREMAQAGVIR